jgi:hypothetical protein
VLEVPRQIHMERPSPSPRNGPRDANQLDPNNSGAAEHLDMGCLLADGEVWPILELPERIRSWLNLTGCPSTRDTLPTSVMLSHW